MSPASASRRKSFGNAMPRSRNLASLARRSVIKWFSSLSLMVADSSKSLLQAGLHEFVECSVEHGRGIADLHPGAQILDPRLIQHVAANLIAPAYVGFRVFEHLRRRVALIELELIELGFQHFHRRRPVLVLAALALAGNDNTARDGGDAHRGFCLVHVL